MHMISSQKLINSEFQSSKNINLASGLKNYIAINHPFQNLGPGQTNSLWRLGLELERL